MKPCAFDYEHIDELSRACAELQGGNARLVAGAQSLGPMLNLRLARPAALLDISRLPELRGFAESDDGLLVGAAVTHAEIEDGLLPDVTRGVLPRVARGIAYRAVRNRGTIGGSLAHADPAADWVSCLSALGGEVVLVGVDGGRRMRVRDFVVGAFHTALRAGELVAAVRVPRLAPGSRFGYFKACRKTGELAHAIGAVFVDSEGGTERVVMGATGGRPVVLEGEGAMAGTGWEEALETSAPGLDELDRRLHLETLRRACELSETL
ncbi:MAG: FAD binding domain-containing protein [Ectothiorhodospiraceae bacterium]|nr:FAD binding domain-containing protein [Ectothiorhodospiraceae bacterium]MCH8505738.1 FAD binding domain-containing protein [Ectothiorhodospiraceae bacterium]